MALNTVMKKLFPGISISALIAIFSLLINAVFPQVSAVLIAVLIGLLINNSISLPAKLEPGISYAGKKLLKLGIILLGIRLSFFEILRLGGSSLLIIITCIILALFLVIKLSERFEVPSRLATLIAIGTAICGNSAIVAASPVIKAKDEEVAFAVGTITIFGLSAIILYPLIGDVLVLTSEEFGVWAGTAINDTAQVVAAGFMYGESAGEVATVVKLTRNIFIAPVIFLFSYLAAKAELDSSKKAEKVNLVKIFPWFVLGFLFVALVRTTGILPEFMVSALSNLADFFIVIALAGIGLGIKFSSMRGLGLKALFTGLFAAVIMGASSLILVKLII